MRLFVCTGFFLVFLISQIFARDTKEASLFEGAVFHDPHPYMFPPQHPMKLLLDHIFMSSYVLEDEEHFSRAGFVSIESRPRNPIRIAEHPWFKGYLFKLFLHSEVPPEKRAEQSEGFIRRCIAAEIIRDLIESHHMPYFSVPNKWLYAVPSSKEGEPSSLILVVTKEHILSHSKSRKAWKTQVSPQLLQDLFLILKRSPISQRLLSNLPYTEGGTFAFIDTERHNSSLAKLQKFFSEDMQIYWNTLIQDPIQTQQSLLPNEEIIPKPN